MDVLLGPWAVAGAGCLLGALLLLLVRGGNDRQNEERLISQAQRRREHSFDEAQRAVQKHRHSFPMMDATSILSLSLPELTEQIKKGSLSAQDVFYSYMEKTLELQRKLNCCAEVILESFEQVKAISSGEKGELYGVPISVKENLLLKNHYSSCGVVKHLQRPADDDCVLVKVLKKQGAIPFVRTNVPQALFSYECSNPIFGPTVNPFDKKRTCGGSSGGEGALIGGGGSVIGLGTDVGGSVRVPSAFCGICGLKPTAGRLSSKGLKPNYRGQKTVLSVAGPMAKDVESLALFMKAVLNDHMFSLDPTVPRLPFNEEMYRSTKPLRIGYYDHIANLPASPSMARAVQEVKALLEQAGHTLVPYTPVRFDEVVLLANKGLLADAAATFTEQLKGSTIDPAIQGVVSLYGTPLWLKKLLRVVLKPLSPKKALRYQAVSGVGSVANLWKVHASIEDCVNDTIAEWRRLNIDVLLCPMLGPALMLNSLAKISGLLPYSIVYNLLNFSAGVVPVSTVTAQDEKDFSGFEPRNEYEQLFKEAASGALGLPVAVQCVALPWQEELCLRLMREVEQLVKNAPKK